MSASPASQLLARPEAVVVIGDRPAQARPWTALGVALALVVAGSVMAPRQAEAFGFSTNGSNYLRVGDSTSARHFENNEALTVQKTAAGRIVGIRPAEIEPRSGMSSGTALGALVGGVIGNRFGHGFSRALSTGAGAVAGGAIGNKLSDNSNRHRAVELFIEPDPQRSFDPRAPRGSQQTLGGTISVVQDADIPYQVGDPVWVVGSGSRIRIVPREIGPAVDASSGMAERMRSRREAGASDSYAPPQNPPRPRP